MLFTPTDKYNIAAKSSAAVAVRSVYARKVTDISLSVEGLTGWTDITDYVTNFDDINTKIEFEFGQFTADSVRLQCVNINYFESNWLNLSATEYLEFKIVFRIGLSETDLATDEIIVFSGFADMEKIEMNGLTNEIFINCYTCQELGNRLKTQDTNVFPQILNDNINGNYIRGMVTRIPDLFIVTQNPNLITLNTSLIGNHTLHYTATYIDNDNPASGSYRYVWLDDYDTNKQQLTGSTYTMLSSSAETASLKLQMYAGNLNYMPTTGTYTEGIQITTTNSLALYPSSSGFSSVSVNTALKKLYNQIGVTAFDVDELNVNTSDNSNVWSPINLVASGTTFANMTTDIVFDELDNMYFGGTLVHKKASGSDSYTTLVTSSNTSDIVSRLLYNSRTKDLWILYGSASYISNNGNANKVVKYNTITGDISNTIVINDLYTRPVACELIDYQLADTSYKYGIVYANQTADVPTGGYLAFITASGNTLTKNIIFSGSQLVPKYNTASFGAITPYHLHVSNSSDIYFCTATGSNIFAIHKTHINSAGTFVDDGRALNRFPLTVINQYNESDNCIYYKPFQINELWSINMSTGVSQSLNYTSSLGMKYVSGSVYGIGYNTAYKLSGNTVTELGILEYLPRDTQYTINVDSAGKLYSSTVNNKIIKFNNSYNMSINYLELYDKTINECINKILKSYNLVATINPRKQAKIYRRSSDSGIIYSGNSKILTSTNVDTITKKLRQYKKIAAIKLSTKDSDSENGVEYNVFWDGSTTSEHKLGTNDRTLTIESSVYPGSLILDLAKKIYSFLSSNRDMYIVSTTDSAFEYENLDGGQLLFTDSNLNITDLGTIYKTIYKIDGSTQFEILV